MHLPSEGGQEEGIWGGDKRKESEGGREKGIWGGDERKESEGGQEKGKGRLIQEHMKYPIFQTIFTFGFFNGKVKFQGQDIWPMGTKWSLDL